MQVKGYSSPARAPRLACSRPVDITEQGGKPRSKPRYLDNPNTINTRPARVSTPWSWKYSSSMRAFSPGTHFDRFWDPFDPRAHGTYHCQTLAGLASNQPGLLVSLGGGVSRVFPGVSRIFFSPRAASDEG